jgi:RNA polymerase sigma factor (sigma-70 family)
MFGFATREIEGSKGVSERSASIAAGARVKLGLGGREERLVAAVRRGDARAFELLYEHCAPELLAFCNYMLGSRQDAEDALQATFASAYRALRSDSRPVAPRPWLFTIARNQCLSMLRRRRPQVELNGEPAKTGDPVRHAEVREEMGQLLAGLRALPETQRAALVLAEVHGLSQAQVGTVLGVRPDQVKAYIYQARTNLISERRAREADCTEIREELASARGAARLKGSLRRHVRACQGCRAYAEIVDRQRRQLAAVMPVLPVLTLRYRALEEALSIGGADPPTYANGASVAGGAAEAAGGGMVAVVAKVAAGLAAIGASAGVGVSVLNSPAPLKQSSGSSTQVIQPARAEAPAAASSLSADAGMPPRESRRAQRRPRNAGAVLAQPNAPARVPLPATSGAHVQSEPARKGPEQRGEGDAKRVAAQPPGAAGEVAPGQSSEARARHEQRAQLNEERKQAREEHRHAVEEQRETIEEHKASRLGKRGEGGREKAGSTEEKPVGASEAPESEEERELKREEHKRRHEEREHEREAQGGEGETHEP